MANLRISELDFDTIKQNLKSFLGTYRDSNGNLVFTDYEFEGSTMSVLLDLLSYNTHYNAYLANMLINEMFLDSAVKRESAVSVAKHLGYTPRSVKGARATVGFEVVAPTGTPPTLTLDRYTPFTSVIDEVTYTFVNLESKTIEPASNVYSFTNVELVEGYPLQYTFRVNNPGPSEKYEIPNPNVDLSTLRVTVQNSNTDTFTTVFTEADDALDIDENSKVYFIEESPTGRYQLVFGDNIIGKKLKAGNLVIVQYLVSSGEIANVSDKIIQTFTSSSLVGGGQISTVTTTSNSNYGALKESISEIKFNAPKFTSSQNRAVTVNDYKVLIKSFYPTLVDSISVWGGEENIPKKYGRVMVSLKPAPGFAISETVKDNITELLKRKQVVSIAPEFVDPEYFYINLDVAVKYNYKLTTLPSDQIKQLVISAINNYFENNLQQFDEDFIFSKLSKDIDNSDESVIGNLITLKIQKRLTPTLNTNVSYTDNQSIKFYVGILPGSLETTRFVYSKNNINYPAKLIDIPNDTVPNYTGSGYINLVNAQTGEILEENYGHINYGTGEIIIEIFNIAGYSDEISDIRIMVKPQNQYLDVTVNRNQLLLLDDSLLNSSVNRPQGLTVRLTAVNA